jgi:uncharacterized damage-inducible protein DinB
MPEQPEQDDVRYPIGRFTPPEVSTPALRAAHVETMRLLPGRLRAAVAGLSEAQLNTPYREGGWTVRQVVHHLADTNANAFVRFKLALTEDWPTINPFEQAAWANLPDSVGLPVDASLVLLDGLQSRWVALLEAMTEDDFQRGFHHPRMGRQTLAAALALYEWHARHHTAHVTSLRRRRGW